MPPSRKVIAPGVSDINALLKVLNSTSMETEMKDPSGANQKFEQLVLGCAARDQKEVKGRLEDLLEQIGALATAE